LAPTCWEWTVYDKREAEAEIESLLEEAQGSSDKPKSSLRLGKPFVVQLSFDGTLGWFLRSDGSRHLYHDTRATLFSAVSQGENCFATGCRVNVRGDDGKDDLRECVFCFALNLGKISQYKTKYVVLASPAKDTDGRLADTIIRPLAAISLFEPFSALVKPEVTAFMNSVKKALSGVVVRKFGVEGIDVLGSTPETICQNPRRAESLSEMDRAFERAETVRVQAPEFNDGNGTESDNDEDKTPAVAAGSDECVTCQIRDQEMLEARKEQAETGKANTKLTKKVKLLKEQLAIAKKKKPAPVCMRVKCRTMRTDIVKLEQSLKDATIDLTVDPPDYEPARLRKSKSNAATVKVQAAAIIRLEKLVASQRLTIKGLEANVADHNKTEQPTTTGVNETADMLINFYDKISSSNKANNNPSESLTSIALAAIGSGKTPPATPSPTAGSLDPETLKQRLSAFFDAKVVTQVLALISV
jgi:hypothetical protein